MEDSFASLVPLLPPSLISCENLCRPSNGIGSFGVHSEPIVDDIGLP